ANILENKWWVNSLSNAFAYLDVILFDDFEHNREEEALKKYDNYAENALTAITLSVYSDGVIESKETDLFHFFLASANLDEDDRDLVRERFKKGATLQDFSSFVARHFLLKRFLFDVSVVTILATHEAQPEEVAFLSELGQHLEIDELEMEASMRMVENFVLKSKDQVAYLSDRSKYDKVYMSFTKRWTKVISRNSEKLKVELRESKELVVLIRKSGSQELTPEEKDAVKTQFKDLAKSIPALTVFMLPGGAVLMPLLLKLIPDLIPSAFKENTIDEEEAKDEDDETTEAPESNPK
ncbi:LETM1 domain-containing protein, partial [Crocinitomicaceae bacterium]|nr:LETM1 domain-containing protein [Crocinitomicaceae bacterium]